MRILHVIRSADPATGGPIQGIRTLAEIHQKQGRVAEVVSLDDPAAPYIASFPLRVHALGPVATNYGYTSRLVSWLRQNASEFDALIVNGLWQYPGFAVWTQFRDSELPYFVFPHGMLDPWFRRTYPLKHLKKWLYWPWAEYRVLRDARAVLFTCEEERIRARDSFWLYRCSERVINYAAPVPAGNASQQISTFYQHFPSLKGKPFVLFLGRIHPKKGLDLLLSAVEETSARLPDLRVLIAGPASDPAYLAALKRRTVEGPFKDIILWGGMLSGDLKLGALRAAEAFILPSHQENFGIAVAEALSCGTPVLISNQVNIWREIDAAGAGFVEPDTTHGTVGLLLRWAQLSSAQKTEMRSRAAHCFVTQFHPEQAAQSLVSTLQSCGVRDRPPASPPFLPG